MTDAMLRAMKVYSPADENVIYAGEVMTRRQAENRKAIPAKRAFNACVDIVQGWRRRYLANGTVPRPQAILDIVAKMNQAARFIPTYPVDHRVDYSDIRDYVTMAGEEV
jgi:hypothetical protein